MGIDPYYERDGITIFHEDWRNLPEGLGLVDFVLTDPPYGVGFDTNFKRFTGGVATSTDSHAAIHGDDEPFDPSPILALKKPTILFGANSFSDQLPKGSWIVWDKRTPNGNKNVMSDGEVAWFSRGHGVYIFNHTWDGFNRASERGTAYHPTQKPVVLMQWLIEKFTKPGDVILDPYMGSGPIARACQLTGRGYIGCEIERSYCEIAISRLQQSVLPLGV